MNLKLKSPSLRLNSPPKFVRASSNAAPFKSKILFHTHIDKAAGTSLIHGLRRSLGNRHVLDLRSAGATPPDQMTTAEKAQIWVVSGHMPYGLHADQFSRAKVYLGCVRPPFERFRSYIQYIAPNRRSWQFVEGRTFPQIIEECLRDQRPCAHNQMARYLTGVQNPTFEEARRNIESHYLFVSPFDRVNDALAALASVTGGAAPSEALHRNKQPEKAMDDPGEWEGRFLAANKIDADLTAYVADNFDRWIETIDDRWASIAAAKNQNAANIILR